MTTSPSEPTPGEQVETEEISDAAPEVDETEEAAAPDPLADYAHEVGQALGGDATSDFGTVKVRIPAERWVETAETARDELGLEFFSWLSAVDWANEVEVGDPPSEQVNERYEVLCQVSDTSEGHFVILSTDIGKDEPSMPSLVNVYPGANWHEREAAEMFGISFVGHPNLAQLYLPPGFEGHPLRKSFPLLTREVKPWPGTVDVEGMPSEENVEAGDAEETE